MASKTTVLVTGANRGIGKGLVTAYLSRPNHIVVAAVRDTSYPTSQSLSTLAVGSGSSLLIVALDASLDTSASEAVKILETEYFITSIDIVIANAAIGVFSGNILQTPLQVVRDHYNVNSIGPLALFQAVYPLLSVAAKTGSTPKFIAVTSTVGSIGDMEKWPSLAAAYGTSKAALHWLIKRIHLDYPELIAFPIHPGWVRSDMGNEGARLSGLAEAPVTIEDCASGMISKIDNATREETSGKFLCYDDELPPW